MVKPFKELGDYIKVTSLPNLLRLLRKPSLTKSAQYRIVLAIDGIPYERNQSLEKKSNLYLQSCGCREGMLSGIALLVLGIVFRPPDGFVFSSIWLDAFLLFLFGAVAGKLATYAFLYTRALADVRKAKVYLDGKIK